MDTQITKKVRLAINGFGRIGRAAFKLALEKPEAVEVAGINDLSPTNVMAHLLKYDSVYGIYKQHVDFDEQHLIINGKKYPVSGEREPQNLKWKDWNADVVVECTGRYTSTELAKAHLEAGAKKVVISAPAKDEGITPTIVMGVNEHTYNGENIISNASCTTNCIAPVIDVLNKRFGVEKLLMTTIHSYTAEQNLVDGSPPGGKKNDLRRARAAAVNMVPTTTGAAISVTQTIPELKGKLDGFAIRVPTPDGSISDFVALLKNNVTVEEVNKAFIEASQEPKYLGKLEVTEEPIVSSDIIGNQASAIVDLQLTKVVDNNLVKVVAWYDNEFGYTNRLVELAIMAGSS